MARFIIDKNQKLLTAITVVLFLLLFLAPIVLFSIYLLYGIENISINYFIDIIGSGQIYKVITDVWPIVYFIIAILILKDIIFSISYFKMIGKIKGEEFPSSEVETGLVGLMDRYGRIYFLIVLFILCTQIFSASMLSGYEMAIIVSGIVIYLLSRFAFSVIKTKDLVGAAYHYLLRSGIFITSIAVLAISASAVDLTSILRHLESIPMVSHICSISASI